MYGKLIFGSVFGLFALAQTQGALAADSTVPGDFATIQEAIDDAGTGPGDKITVSGPHAEDGVVIGKSVTIAGDGIGLTTITLGVGAIGFRPEADGVTIEDMTIQGGLQAIRFEKAGGTIDGAQIMGVRMLDQSSRGVEVHNATTVTNLLVDQSEFVGGGHGLRVSSSGHLDGVEFRDSTFDGNTIGIYVANDGGTSTAKNILVTGSTFQNIAVGQGTAIFVEELQDAVIEQNQFIDNRRDIQIFKWYQAAVPVSDVVIRNNTMTGTTNAVFAIFNAHHTSGQTMFDGVRFSNNTATGIGMGAVFAGAHSTFQNADPSDGGVGWDTVAIRCNTFLGIPPANAEGVRFFNTGVAVGEELGGASIDVSKNWWGTTDESEVAALLQIPAITDYLPILDAAPTVACDSIIDIKPGSDPNGINPKNKGVIPVAILTTPDFDATTVDISTVRFGPSEASPARPGRVEDVDGDGDDDMIFHFRTQATGIVKGDTEACLTGMTLGGESIAGCDTVKTVGK